MYARFSTDLQKETSIEDQLRRCHEIATSHGFTPNPQLIFSDEALSGTAKHTRKRVGLQALLDAWDRGEIEVLIVDEFCRLSRDGVLDAELQQRIEDTGIRLITADGLDTAHENWQLSLGLRGIVSQQFIRDTKHRVKRGMLGQLERGYMIAPPPFGYDYEREYDERGNRVGTHWIINEQQAKTVREIFESRVNGMALGAIAKMLNERGIPLPRLKKNGTGYWRPGSIARMLANTIYRGEFVWHGSSAFQTQSKKKKKDPELQVFARPHLRIVDDVTWYACNRKKISRSGYGGGRHRLSGLVNCGTCGAVLTVATGGNTPSLYCAQCSQARRVGIKRYRTGYLACKGLEHVLIAAIRSTLSANASLAFRERLRQRLTQGGDEELARTRLEKEQAKRACERLAKALRHTDGDEYLLTEYEEAMHERRWKEKLLAELESRRAIMDKHAIEKQLAFDPKELIPRLFNSSLPVERIRALLSRLFEEIVFESKLERFVAIVCVTFSPGVVAAIATETVPVDTRTTTMRFRLSTGARRPTIWKVDLL
jgi:DNA invertase Pin-like site-specific DNA recombinase